MTPGEGAHDTATGTPHGQGADTGALEAPTEGATPGAMGPVGGPRLSMAEAVRVSGVPRSTMQRRLKAGAIPGAERTADGGWSIPFAGLVAAGIIPKSTPPDAPVAPPADLEAVEVVQLRAEVSRLRAEVDHARELAAERARHVDDLRGALEAMARMLPPGEGDTAGGGAPRRRRWRR